MKTAISLIAFICVTVQPAFAMQERPAADEKPMMREGINGFRGLLVGRLIEKDVERGTFSVKIDRVARVWRNNKARNMKSLVGRTVQVEGVEGKFLDKLLVLRKGETLQFGAFHNGGERLRVGELFRKVAPYRPEDYPELPEKFRGFRGALAVRVQKKDPEIRELLVNGVRVLDTWKENGARDAKTIVGRTFLLSGFYRYRKQFDEIKVGDTLEVGATHTPRASDHLTVAEFVRKAGQRDVAMKSRESEMKSAAGFQRFNGMLVGRLISKDVEKGQFQIEVDRVSRVWRNSRASNPKALVGRTVTVGNVTGKWLDVLLLVKKGETMEFECQHTGGEIMNFPGELMRKVPPVKPGDYPELPEEFRGFHGAVVGTVVRKDPEMLEAIVKADKVTGKWKKNKARRPESIVGKRFILAGFWNRRDAYNSLKVGDQIEVGLEHISVRSDHLSISEFIRKSKSTDREGDK